MKATQGIAIEFFVYKYADQNTRCRFAMPHKVNSQGEIISYRQCKKQASDEIDGYHFCGLHARIINAKRYRR